MKINKINLKKIKGFFGKLSRILGEKAFLTFLGLLIIFLIFGAFLFYKYIFLVEKTQPEILEKPLQFNEGLLWEILQRFEEKEKKFEETKTKEYPNPFIRTIIIEEVPGEEELSMS